MSSFPSFCSNSSTSSSPATASLPHCHHQGDFNANECEGAGEKEAVEVLTSPHRNLVTTLVTPSSPASSSRSFFLGFPLLVALLFVSTLSSVFPSVLAASPLEMENNNNAEVWPMNLDGLFASEQFNDNIKPVSTLLTSSSSSSSSSSEFDFFSPLSATRDHLAMAPDFNVMSSTSFGTGPQVGWQSSSPTYYQVLQGSSVNLTSTLQVSDSAGVVVIPFYVGTVTVSITVAPSSLGTLSVTPVSGLSISTASSGVSTITVSGNFAVVQKSLNSTLQFTAATTAAGNATLTFSTTLPGISTSFSTSLIVNVQAIPTTVIPTTVTPTTASTPTTALPTPAASVVRIQFSLGSLSSITVNSRGLTTQQRRSRFVLASTVLTVGSAGFNARLALDICNVTQIAAVYCSQRVKVESTFQQNSVTFAVVDFFPLNTTGTVSANISSLTGPTSAAALAQAFTNSASSWSTVPTLQSASVSTISFYCSYTDSYTSASSCTAPSSSSSSPPWWIPLVVILPFFFVLAIVIIAVILVRKRRQQQQQQTTKTGTKKVEVELASREKAAPITTSPPPAQAAAAESSTPIPAVLPAPAASSEEATTSSPAAVPVQGGQYAVVEPGLKFMYSAPDWEPDEVPDSAAGAGAARQDVHVHLDPAFDPAGTASPQRTMESDNASRFSYVPKND